MRFCVRKRVCESGECTEITATYRLGDFADLYHRFPGYVASWIGKICKPFQCDRNDYSIEWFSASENFGIFEYLYDLWTDESYRGQRICLQIAGGIVEKEIAIGRSLK